MFFHSEALTFEMARESFTIELCEVAVFDLDGGHAFASFAASRLAHWRLCSSAFAILAR
jgi:hypothetical protein